MHHVFLIGDSIRMGYCNAVRDILQGIATVDFPGENCRFSTYTLCCLGVWAEQLTEAIAEQIDLVFWNNGLWDVCHNAGDPLPLVPPDQYRMTLHRIADRIRTVFPNAKIIFALTTEADETRTKVQNGIPMRTNAEIKLYNSIARGVMEKESIPVFDLCSLATALGNHLKVDWVHFTEEGYQLLAQHIAAHIQHQLDPSTTNGGEQ